MPAVHAPAMAPAGNAEPVGSGKLFIPEELTPLSFTPSYRELTAAQRLRYNQLHGLYFTEQILFFETVLGRRIPLVNCFAVMFGFGLLWSAMQYAHHYGTVREVQKAALNLKTFGLLDLVWLNHNWHLNHHMHPTLPNDTAC